MIIWVRDCLLMADSMRHRLTRRATIKTGAAATAITLAGCIGNIGGGGGEVDSTPDSITALGGDSSGSGYQQCLGLQQVIENELDMTVSVTGTDGWSANAELMYQRGEAEVGVLPAGDVYDILHGVDPYSGENYYVAQMYPAVPPAYVHAVVLSNSGIEEYSDLEGARMNVLTRGSLTEEIQPTVMDALGYEFEAFHYPHDEAANALRQGDIDAVVGAGPAAAYLEVSQQEDINVVTLTENDLGPIQEALPWLSFETVDFSEHYEGANEALVPAPWTVIGCLLDLDDEFVYDLTSTIWENTDTIAGVYEPAETLEVELVPDTNVALHPGAQQYYEDEGISIPDAMVVPDPENLPMSE